MSFKIRILEFHARAGGTWAKKKKDGGCKEVVNIMRLVYSLIDISKLFQGIAHILFR